MEAETFTLIILESKFNKLSRGAPSKLKKTSDILWEMDSWAVV